MKLKLLILVLALQTAWLLGITVIQERGLTSGKAMLLEVEPVDPRDMLRGNYLMLTYKISDVPTNVFSPPLRGSLPRASKVYVALSPGEEGFYKVARASVNPLVPAADEVILQGNTADWWPPIGGVHVDYGIGRYYVAEGSGPARGKLTARVRVQSSGRATIQQLFVDGQPYGGGADSSPN